MAEVSVSSTFVLSTLIVICFIAPVEKVHCVVWRLLRSTDLCGDKGREYVCWCSERYGEERRWFHRINHAILCGGRFGFLETRLLFLMRRLFQTFVSNGPLEENVCLSVSTPTVKSDLTIHSFSQHSLIFHNGAYSHKIFISPKCLVLMIARSHVFPSLLQPTFSFLQ